MKNLTAVAVPKRRLVRRSAQQWRALIQSQARSGRGELQARAQNPSRQSMVHE